jgi:protein-L-isoaspartate(D-aspartate) O-methyltransferase
MSIYEDKPTHKGLRKRLIDQLREKGIRDERVLEAMNNIPRHFFLPHNLEQIAYEDRAFPIGEDQTISQPYTVAFQTELLQVESGEKILEIGTGSVYQASVLAEMGAFVYTIERQQALFEKNKRFILKNKYPNIQFFLGDGFLGLSAIAPFNKIIITAGAPHIPDSLLKQLAPGGFMVIPVNEGEVQRMLRITKFEDNSTMKETFQNFSFVPMLAGVQKKGK